jgi:hypothetical protein
MTDLLLGLSAEIPASRLARITRDLSRDLTRAGFSAKPVDGGPPAPGERGDPVTIGAIALALVTSGAVKALLECLKAYLSRERGLTIKLTRPGGLLVEITSRNIDTSYVHDALLAATSSKQG